jgi:hypothetical protein
VLASNFPPAKVALTIQLQWFLLPWLPAAAFIAVWRAFLNSRGHFAVPAIAPIATPLMTLVALWASAARFGPYALCIGTLAGVVAECGLLAWAVFRLGGPLRPMWSGWTPEIAQIRRRYVPLVAGVLASSSAVIVDQAIAAMASQAQLLVVREEGMTAGRAYSRTAYAMESDPPLFEHWTIQGAGHAWSGGSVNGSFTDIRGPDASAEMIKFFQTHAR